MPYYRGVIENHHAMKSANKGTPGLEFQVTIREKKVQGKWRQIEWFERRVWLYFPDGGNFEFQMKKLAFAGYTGGGLRNMDLRGNTVEIVSTFETFDGKEREKFELALPAGGGGSEPDDAAFAAIDAVISSEAVPTVATLGKAGEAPAKPEPSAGDSFDPGPSAADFYDVPDDDVPF